MVTRQAQVDRERAWLDGAFELLKIQPTRVDKREAPDFLVEIDGRNVGVEVVEARDARAASARGAMKRLCRRAEADLSTAGFKVVVWVRFRAGAAEHLETNPAELDRQVAALVRLCTDHVQQRRSRHYYDEHELERAGVGWINHVTIYENEEAVVGWTHSSRGQRSGVIQAAIDAKATKLLTYRSVVSEVWLLLVGGGGIGAAIDIHEAEDSFVSPFDRTFFLELYEGKCVELETVPPPTRPT